jgi:hypothetical protein
MNIIAPIKTNEKLWIIDTEDWLSSSAAASQGRQGSFSD